MKLRDVAGQARILARVAASTPAPYPSAADADGGASTIDDVQRAERKRKRKAARRARRGNRR
jgi:hypothetical protein